MTKEQVANSIGKYFVHQKGVDLACIEIIKDVKFLKQGNSNNIPAQIYYRETSTLIFSIERAKFCNIFNSIEEAKLYIELEGYTEVPNTVKRNSKVFDEDEEVEDFYLPDEDPVYPGHL